MKLLLKPKIDNLSQIIITLDKIKLKNNKAEELSLIAFSGKELVNFSTHYKPHNPEDRINLRTGAVY